MRLTQCYSLQLFTSGFVHSNLHFFLCALSGPRRLWRPYWAERPQALCWDYQRLTELWWVWPLLHNIIWDGAGGGGSAIPAENNVIGTKSSGWAKPQTTITLWGSSQISAGKSPFVPVTFPLRAESLVPTFLLPLGLWGAPQSNNLIIINIIIINYYLL